MSSLKSKKSPERKATIKLFEAMNRNIETDNQELGRLVAEGNTSGILDNEDGYRIAWELKVNKFKH